MKRTLTGIVVASMVAGTAVPTAFASATGSTVGGRKDISLNGNVISQPYTRVALDSGNETSYIGVWYLGQAVKAAGGSYTWNPTNKVFDLTIPGVDASKINVLGGVGSGDTTLQVNGTPVKKLNSFAAQDPAGGTGDVTTFVPLYYIGNVFKKLGSDSSWDGNTFAFKMLNQTKPSHGATTKFPLSEKSIYVGSTKVATVDGLVYNGTTYIPIWYVIRALKSLGVQSSWSNNVWSMTWGDLIPSILTHINPTTGSGDSSIQIDGAFVKQVNRIAYPDPASHVMTTYMPIWYVMQALNDLKICSTWDGTNWHLKRLSTDSKLDVAVDLFSTLNIPVVAKSPSPFDDIPSSSAFWSAIHTLVSEGIVVPDSATHFGINDPVTVHELDTMYWNAQHVPTGDSAYEPGGNPDGMANVIGLNKGLGSSDSYISPVDEQQVYTNEAGLEWHYVHTGYDQYQLVYPVQNYSSFLSKLPTNPTTENIQQALQKAYTLLDETRLNICGPPGLYYTFTIPGLSDNDSSKIEMSDSVNDISYSLDGGKTWQSSPDGSMYDSSNPDAGGTPTPPKNVLIRTRDSTSVYISAVVPGFCTLSLSPSLSLGHYGDGTAEITDPFSP